MRRKFNSAAEPEQSTLSRLLGPPGGNRDEEPPASSKMSIEDGYISFELRIYSKYKLLFEFRRQWIHEALFKKKEIPYAARKIRGLLGVMSDLANEQFIAALRSIFGWCLPPGRPRQKEVIFLLPDTPSTSMPESQSPQPQSQCEQ